MADTLTAPHADEKIAPRYMRLTIPDRVRPHGPVTRRRLRRLQFALGGAWLLALIPLVSSASNELKAFALGILFPGGGFLFTGDPVFAVVALMLFLLAFVVWFATGNVLGPPIVWAGTAALATLRVGGGVWTWAEIAVPVALATAVVLGASAGELRFRAARRRAAEMNERLVGLELRPPKRAAAMPVLELSEEDLQVQRGILELALQPLDEFAGYDWIDQFQTAAVRYQLNFQQYALAMCQFCHAPAFTGYLAAAQRRLIEKMLDRRVWRYWFFENLWGYLRIDPNPVPRRDNVMLTGYMGTMLGAYEQATGDGRYAEPGALTFRWDERRAYPNDFHSIAANVFDNMSTAAFCLYPCEPNWIYSSCNTMAITALMSHSSRYGSSYFADVIGDFRVNLEREFMTADGRLVGIRSARLGFSLPGITSTMADCISAFFISAAAPDIARRTWEITRSRFIHPQPDGSVQIEKTGWDKLDTGNYKPGSDVGVHWSAMLAARAMGDEDVAEAVQSSADAKFQPVVEDGVRRYTGASNQANAILALGRFSRKDGWHDLIGHGTPDAWSLGPVLADANYPDVLVALASTDGTALDLVLRPGNDATRTPLRLGRLLPGRRYNARGTVEGELTSAADGTATVHVDLDGRTEINLYLTP